MSKYFSKIALILISSFLFTQDVVIQLDDGILNYVSSTEIAGFQFDHNGCIEGASGGDAENYGFTISSGESTLLAFSLHHRFRWRFNNTSR